jgi:hypothetical protein
MTSYFKSDIDSALENFKSWEEWQNKQLPSHYIDCQLQSYIPNKPGFKNLYTKYCFGCFENLIYLPEYCDAIRYLTLLISVYDQCKGYVRTFKGDTAGITLIRKVIKNNNLDVLYEHDFNIYDYNYTKLHANTVAYHSLSTLILFFVSNYMHFKSYNANIFPHIDQDLCKNTYNAKIYGDISYVQSSKKSEAIKIKSKEDILTNKPCHSWPGINYNVLPSKCDHCSRVCENYWGKNKHCLDCHLYKVCVICGGELFSIGKDNYPRCVLHQNSV